MSDGSPFKRSSIRTTITRLARTDKRVDRLTDPALSGGLERCDRRSPDRSDPQRGIRRQEDSGYLLHQQPQAPLVITQITNRGPLQRGVADNRNHHRAILSTKRAERHIDGHDRPVLAPPLQLRANADPV